MIALDLALALVVYGDDAYAIGRLLAWLSPYALVTPTAWMFVVGRQLDHATGGYLERLDRRDAALAHVTYAIVVATGACCGSTTWLAVGVVAGTVTRNYTARYFVEHP